METKYKRDLNHTYLILELPILYEEDYQMKMLQANEIEGFVPVAGQGMDGKSQYFYEISEKTCLKSIYEKAEMKKEELEKFLVQFLGALNSAQKYLLDINKILLEPEYIFCDNEKYYFCYLPIQEAEICKEFHRLTEYFVSKIDHKEQAGILLAYELHKATVEENYNLEKIVERLQEEKEETVSYVRPEIIEEDFEDDWIDYQETGTSLFRESSVKWKKTRQKWKKRSGDKWGEWEE